MSAPLLLQNLQASGFTLLADGPTLFITPASKLSSDDRAQIKQHKPELLRLLAEITCNDCSQPLHSSGPYHSWCQAGHYDSQSPIPAGEQVNYCKYHHDPLAQGGCERCEEGGND